jgi:DNA-binding XRE family transcriptional regulator
MFEEWFWPYGPTRRAASPLCSARNRSGMSQEELAAAASVSRRTISSLERAHSSPSLRVARALARVLDRPLDELFPEDES